MIQIWPPQALRKQRAPSPIGPALGRPLGLWSLAGGECQSDWQLGHRAWGPARRVIGAFPDNVCRFLEKDLPPGQSVGHVLSRFVYSGYSDTVSPFRVCQSPSESRVQDGVQKRIDCPGCFRQLIDSAYLPRHCIRPLYRSLPSDLLSGILRSSVWPLVCTHPGVLYCSEYTSSRFVE